MEPSGSSEDATRVEPAGWSEPTGDADATRVEMGASTSTPVPGGKRKQIPASAKLRTMVEGSMGARLGRYSLLRVLGEGAMGVVFAAYDEELDRKLAIKLLRKTSGQIDQSWLLNEAKAMARVNHPNIVQVYDVGQFEGQLFVVMEFVAGVTLDAWLSERARSHEQVLELFEQAGRGLEAAHAAKLVHCDFKLANTMLGEDGRVRVLDFGLALLHARGPEAGDAAASASSSRASAIVGTPAYMAPEIYAGADADPRGDQFAFCVALYRALFDEFPFQGEDLRELARAIKTHKLSPLPRDTKVPARVRNAVLRGLEADPQARWPSMAALLDELRPPSHNARRNLLLVGAAALCVGVGASWAFDTQESACVSATTRSAQLWSEDDARTVESAMRETQMAFAEVSAQTSLAALGDYARAWGEIGAAACEDHREGRSSERALALQTSCLDRQATSFRATVELLREADAQVVEKAVELAAALPPISACADRLALVAADERALPEPPELEAPIAEARERLAEVEALRIAGRFEQSWERLQTLDEHPARAWSPMAAELELAAGTLLTVRGEFDAARPRLWAALVAAESGPSRELSARSSLGLAYLEVERGEFPAVEPWLELAEVLAEPEQFAHRISQLRGLAELSQANYDPAFAAFEDALQHATSPIEVGPALRGQGQVRRKQGRYDEAAELLERARAQYEAALGPGHPWIADIYGVLGVMLSSRGDNTAALEAFRATLKIREATLGPDHPRTAVSLTNIGGTALHLGEFDEAEQALRRAIEIREAKLGPDHPQVGDALYNLSLVHARRGQLEQAQAALLRSHEINLATRGEDSPELAYDYDLLGSYALERGDLQEALRRYSQAVAQTERLLGDKHPDLAYWLTNRANVQLELGQSEQAKTDLERSLVIHEIAGSDPSAKLIPMLGLADLALDSGDKARALDIAEQVYAACDDPEASAHRRGAAWTLARALRANRREPARARKLAEEALELLEPREGTPRDEAMIADIQAWLEQ